MCDIDLIYIYIVLVYFVHKSTLREILFLKNTFKKLFCQNIYETTFVKKKKILTYGGCCTFWCNINILWCEI